MNRIKTRKGTSRLVRRVQTHRNRKHDAEAELRHGEAKAAEREWKGNPY